jgi:hypothetical protein
MLNNASSLLIPLAVVFSSASVLLIALLTLSAIILSLFLTLSISVSFSSSYSSSLYALLLASLTNASYALRCRRVN